MKKFAIVITVLALIGLSNALSGQNEQKPCTYEPGFEKMTIDLNLSEQQLADIKATHEQFQIEMDNLRADETLTMEERRKTMKSLHQNRRAEVEKILTVEQLQKFQGNKPFPSGRYRRGISSPGFNEEIHAQMLQMRKDFEQFLSTDEKQTIENLRREFNLKFSKRREKCTDNNRMFRGNRGPGQEEMMGELDPIKGIAENHRAELEIIREKIRLMHENLNVESEEQTPGKGTPRIMGQEGRMLIHFLLLDPATDPGFLSEVDLEEQKVVKLYPNPASNFINIEFKTDKKENVSIELLDKHGLVAKILDVSNRIAGTQTFLYNVSELASGDIYYIRVSIKSEVFVEKFIKL